MNIHDRAGESGCRDASLELDEPIAGTAVATITRWILLQYQGRFEPKAYPGAELPSPVRAHLDQALAGTGTRLQLIRRSSHRPADGLALYLARAAPEIRELLSYRLSSYEALVDLDLIGLLDGTASGPRFVQDRPLYLVCTHGTRDRCCARWGMEVFRALRKTFGDAVWQADHLGGHRFAANVLSLPDGLAFGRLTVDDVPDFAASMAEGGLPELGFYRGRCCYSPPEQAAEWFLFDELQRRDASAFRLRSSVASDDGWTVTFEGGGDGEAHVIEVAETPLPEPLVKSCGAEPVAVTRFVRR